MNTKRIAVFAVSALMLAGCSSAPASTSKSGTENAKQETKTEKQQIKTEKREDIRSDVIDGILSDLEKDGFKIEKDFDSDGITNATIHEAEKGKTDYEFFIFANDADAKAGIQTLYNDELVDQDTDEGSTLTFSDDQTQIEDIDMEDHEVTLYVLNDNVIVKGTVPQDQYDAMKEQFITWGFLYGEQVTNEDIEKTEKNN